MKWMWCWILLVALVDPGEIRRINAAKANAKKAYVSGDYASAIQQYRYLIDSLHVDEEEVRMNLANAYFETKDSTQAFNAYLPLTQSKNPRYKSVAHQQLGILNNRQGKAEEALNDFKQALKADPTNEDARYNYEMVKKKLEEKKKQEQKQQDQDKKDQQQDENKESKDQKDQNKDQQQKDQQQKDQQKKDQEKQDQQNKEQKDKEQQQKEQEQKENEQKNEEKQVPPSVQEKLKDMNMSEEKAKMILEAMKNQEIQYLQQNKRKASKPKDKGKPDW